MLNWIREAQDRAITATVLPAKPTQLSFGFSITEAWAGLWGGDDVALLWRWDTANIRAYYRKADGRELAAPFYHFYFITAINRYIGKTLSPILIISLLLETPTQGWGVTCRAQESPALSWGTHPAHGHCHVLAQDMPKIQTQTSSFVCTEPEEQDSPGFTRIFLKPPPPVLYSVSSSVRANCSYNYCHNYYFNKNQWLIKILRGRHSRLFL